MPPSPLKKDHLLNSVNRGVIKTPGSPPRATEDGEQLDKLFREGIETLSRCYERKSNEHSQLEEVVSSQRNQILSLEATIGDLTREVTQLKSEKKALGQSHNALIGRYAALRKSVSQLESFRQSIAIMVESAPRADEGPDLLEDRVSDDRRLSEAINGLDDTGSVCGLDDTLRANDLSLFEQSSIFKPADVSGNHESSAASLAKLTSEENPTFTPQRSFSKSITTKPQTPSFTNPSSRRVSGPDPSARDVKNAPSYRAHPPPDQLTKLTNTTPRTTTTLLPNGSPQPRLQNPNATTNTIDAPHLYRSIRNSLTPPDFEKFAFNVAQFNAGKQTPEVTVRNITGIVKDEGLVEQMTRLIWTALDESGVAGGRATGGTGGSEAELRAGKGLGRVVVSS